MRPLPSSDVDAKRSVLTDADAILCLLQAQRRLPSLRATELVNLAKLAPEMRFAAQEAG